jgi:hypothetical protein
LSETKLLEELKEDDDDSRRAAMTVEDYTEEEIEEDIE